MRYRGILHRYYLYAVCTQLIHHAPKFLQGTSLYCFTCRNCPLLEKLDKAYEFMKKFVIEGKSMLDKFLEWIGEKVREGRGR
jgi:hypothetical protein